MGSVASRSFAWPRRFREAKGIARKLFTNHCGWAGVLVVHGRCFSSSRACFGSNMVLGDLLWNWSTMRRPYIVYKEGGEGIAGGDLVPAWLNEWCVCVCVCIAINVGVLWWMRFVGVKLGLLNAKVGIIPVRSAVIL